MTTAVIYHYFEKNGAYADNLRFFLASIAPDDPARYFIMISGPCTLSLPEDERISYHQLENANYDFGGLAAFFERNIWRQFDHVVCVNCSVRGPFLPPYHRDFWHEALTGMLGGDVALAGSSINVLPANKKAAKTYHARYGGAGPVPHVQTMCYAMSRRACRYLVRQGFFAPGRRLDRSAVIADYELRLTQLILQRGWNIACLLPDFSGVDFRDPAQVARIPIDLQADLNKPGAYGGRTLSPFETLFMKTERNLLPPAELASLSRTVLQTRPASGSMKPMREDLLDRLERKTKHQYHRKRLAFDPDRPLEPEILTLPNAMVLPEVPNGGRGPYREAGVLDADGTFVEASLCWRGDQMPMTKQVTAIPPLGPTRRQRGRWLFCGLLYQHFGHFFMESASRLWAVDHLAESAEGLVFLAATGPMTQADLSRVRNRLSAFGLDHLAIEVPVVPTIYEHLAVPPQGAGLQRMVVGSPEYRAFIARRFFAEIRGDGPHDLYISRERLGARDGRILGEAMLSDLMAREGFTVFHPQEHDLAVQVQTYRGARRIVASDCSALHVAAMACGPDTEFAIIKRREGRQHKYFEDQIRALTKREPLIVDALTGDCYSYLDRRESTKTYTTVDFERVRFALAKREFVKGKTSWQGPTAEERAQELEHLKRQLGRDILLLAKPN